MGKEVDHAHYESVNVLEMELEGDILTYPCPCGDIFELTVEAFLGGNNVAQCPTCSLTIQVIVDMAFSRADAIAKLRSPRAIAATA
jgi:diphthamide biosynthesis protein 3